MSITVSEFAKEKALAGEAIHDEIASPHETLMGEEAEECLNWLKERVRKMNVGTTCFFEYPLRVLGADREIIMHGRADVVIISPSIYVGFDCSEVIDCCEVIDWKTGDMSNVPYASENLQLHAYAVALMQMSKSTMCLAGIYHPDCSRRTGRPQDKTFVDGCNFSWEKSAALIYWKTLKKVAPPEFESGRHYHFIEDLEDEESKDLEFAILEHKNRSFQSVAINLSCPFKHNTPPPNSEIVRVSSLRLMERFGFTANPWDIDTIVLRNVSQYWEPGVADKYPATIEYSLRVGDEFQDFKMLYNGLFYTSCCDALCEEECMRQFLGVDDYRTLELKEAAQ